MLCHENIVLLLGLCFPEVKGTGKNWDDDSLLISFISPWMKNGNAVQYLKTLGEEANWKVRSKLVLETAEGLAFRE